MSSSLINRVLMWTTGIVLIGDIAYIVLNVDDNNKTRYSIPLLFVSALAFSGSVYLYGEGKIKEINEYERIMEDGRKDNKEE